MTVAKLSTIDDHLGARLRDRRRFLNQTQAELGAKIGIGFQQIQKYETGQNRLYAARLYQLAKALKVPVSYFYEGIDRDTPASDDDSDFMNREETIALVRAYYRLDVRPRRQFLELAKSFGPAE